MESFFVSVQHHLRNGAFHCLSLVMSSDAVTGAG